MSIKNMLKKDPPKMLLIQARISEQLVQDLRPFMKKNHYKWTDVVRASLQFLSDEVKGRKK